MKIKNKEGVSNVVTTILLILITIVAATLLGSFIIPFVRNTLAQSSQCIGYESYYKFQTTMDLRGENYNFNCWQGEMYGFSIYANGGKTGNKELNKFAVVFYSADYSKRVDIEDNIDSTENITMLSAAEKLKVPELGGIQTYVFKSDKEFSKIEVFPILDNGKLCEKTDEINIVSCAGNVNLIKPGE